MTEYDQLLEVNQLSIDMVGFNFYPDSARYFENSANKSMVEDEQFKRVGVFVNASLENVKLKVEQFKLDYVQLHGGESPEYCAQVAKTCPVIKAFGLNNQFDFNQLNLYEQFVSFFLFDTRSQNYGGSGVKFDWVVLEEYNGAKPFMLSGGIHLSDIDGVLDLKHPQLFAIDVNSGFEIAPGIKNIELLKKLTDRLR